MTRLKNIEILSPNKVTPGLPWPLATLSNAQPGVILPAQLRAARGLLRWGRAECGKAAEVSPETIKNIEHGAYKPHDMTSAFLIRTFAAHGVELINLAGFHLQTQSDNDLSLTINIAGAVLVTPASGADRP